MYELWQYRLGIASRDFGSLHSAGEAIGRSPEAPAWDWAVAAGVALVAAHWAALLVHSARAPSAAAAPRTDLAETSTAPQSVPFASALREGRYWLLWLALFAGVGGGQLVVDSLDDVPGDTGVQVSVFAVGNSLGRFVVGYASDALLAHVDRAGFVVVTAPFSLSLSLSLLSDATGTQFFTSLCSSFEIRFEHPGFLAAALRVREEERK